MDVEIILAGLVITVALTALALLWAWVIERGLARELMAGIDELQSELCDAQLEARDDEEDAQNCVNETLGWIATLANTQAQFADLAWEHEEARAERDYNVGCMHELLLESDRKRRNLEAEREVLVAGLRVVSGWMAYMESASPEDSASPDLLAALALIDASEEGGGE